MRTVLNSPLLLVAILVLAQPSVAQENKVEQDGNWLLKHCIQAVRSLDGDSLDGTKGMRSMYCLGYISGFVSSHTLTVLITETSPLFCAPKGGFPRGGLQTGQSVRIVVKWLNDHPENLHLDGGMLTLMALRTAFPCETDDPEKVQ